MKDAEIKLKSKNQKNQEQEIAKVLKKRFNKITDPNYSLFDEEYKRLSFMNRIFWVFLLGGLPLFILGLVLLILGNIFGIIPITFGGMGIMMLMYLPILIMDRRKFKPIMELKEKKQIDKLLELAKKYSLSNSTLDQERARIATYLLIDFKSKGVANILKTRLQQRKPGSVRLLLRAYYLLAIKFGYNDHIEMFYDEGLSNGRVKEQKKFVDEVDNEIVVPISKIYYIDEIPTDAKCMITGLTFDFVADEIVVCPYCSAWAKKELLASWLSENDFCPVCRRELHLADCPTVEYSPKKKG